MHPACHFKDPIWVAEQELGHRRNSNELEKQGSRLKVPEKIILASVNQVWDYVPADSQQISVRQYTGIDP